MQSLDSLEFEKILVYLGPSLPLDKARQILPQAIFRPPAKQGDILSDVVNLSPNVIILIDGELRQNLSPWHKELVYALQYPGVKRIYGAASMGALRAAELDFVGMIGIGQIYQWYRDGVTEDDSEVVLSYATRQNGVGTLYYPLTVPLVEIRAGVEHYHKEFKDAPEVCETVDQFFRAMQIVNCMERTEKLCAETWDNALGVSFPRIPIKEIDARDALATFSFRVPEPKVTLGPQHLSPAFQALYERDRKIKIGDQEIPQQHIDSYALLHNPEYERICWDSANQELALMLCNALAVMVSLDEIERESNRFQQRCGIETSLDFDNMLAANGWTKQEFNRLMVQNARIHKLQHCLTVSKYNRRNTGAILDYLRTHQGFDYWALLAARKEAQIASKGIDEQVFDLGVPVWKRLSEHFDEAGLDLKSSHEEFLLETGFSNPHELSIALSRLSAAKEN